MEYTLFALNVTEEGKTHIVMDSVFEVMECTEQALKIMRSYDDMFISIANRLTEILVKAQEEK